MSEAQRIEVVEDTHSRLRKAALELFCDNGYQSTSLRDLASRLGMQAGSLYVHMKSKQSLLFELIEEVLEDLIADSSYSIKRENSFEKKLDRFIRVYIEFYLAEWRSLALLEREMANLSESQRARIQQLKQDYAGCLRGLLEPQLKSARLPHDILTTLTHSILGMLRNLQHWYGGEQAMSKENIVTQIALIVKGAVDSLKQPARP